MKLHQLSNCYWCRCRCVISYLQLKDGQHQPFGLDVLLLSFTEGTGYLLPSSRGQFLKLNLHLTKPHHVLLHRFGDCAHHSAGFIIFAQLALLYLFIILIFLILCIVRTSKITWTVSHSHHHLLIGHLWLSVHQSGIFRFPYIILLLLNRCLCIFNSLSCPCGLSINIILDSFYLLFNADDVHFQSFLGRKCLFGSQAVQCPKYSDSLYFLAPLGFVCLMTLLGNTICSFTILACQKRRKVRFQNIDQGSLDILCGWGRCWILQDMGNMEASCVFYVMVGTFTPHEQSKISLLTFNTT